MAITAPETTLESLDSGALREMLSNTDAEIDAASSKIDALESRIRQYQERQTELAAQLEQVAHQLIELGKERDEVAERHDLAEKARAVSATSPAKAVTEAHAQHWEQALHDLQQHYDAAHKEHVKMEQASKREQASIQEALAQDEGERLRLEQERQLLQKSSEQTFLQLGQATFRELEEKFRQLGEYEAALEMVLKDTQAPIRQLQEDLPQLLGEWPDLLQKAMRLYGKEREKTETERILVAFRSFLEELGTFAEKETKYTGDLDEYEMTGILTLTENDVRTILGRDISQGLSPSNGIARVSQRIRAVEKHLQEIDQAQQRARDGRARQR